MDINKNTAIDRQRLRRNQRDRILYAERRAANIEKNAERRRDTISRQASKNADARVTTSTRQASTNADARVTTSTRQASTNAEARGGQTNVLLEVQ
ncbi:unnamed protein product [Ectocarpus sp. CCAP 1310/34]|nr:unnamed protein product [Ectocarpus sp. CCAP 1310/34]